MVFMEGQPNLEFCSTQSKDETVGHIEMIDKLILQYHLDPNAKDAMMVTHLYTLLLDTGQVDIHEAFNY